MLQNVKTFNDVKGCDEAKAELEEIVEYLKNPAKFTRLGGKLPKVTHFSKFSMHFIFVYYIFLLFSFNWKFQSCMNVELVKSFSLMIIGFTLTGRSSDWSTWYWKDSVG